MRELTWKRDASCASCCASGTSNDSSSVAPLMRRASTVTRLSAVPFFATIKIGDDHGDVDGRRSPFRTPSWMKALTAFFSSSLSRRERCAKGFWCGSFSRSVNRGRSSGTLLAGSVASGRASPSWNSPGYFFLMPSAIFFCVSGSW